MYVTFKAMFAETKRRVRRKIASFHEKDYCFNGHFK